MTSTTAANVTPLRVDPIERALRDRVRDALETDPALSQGKIAQQIGQGVSGPTFSQWLNGNYPGDNDKIDARVAAWLETYEERRASGGLPAAPEWFESPTAQRILQGLRYCQISQDMGVIYGPAGISKTKACLHYARISPAVIHATMTPAEGNLQACMQAIALAMGMKDLPASAGALNRAIVSRLRVTNGLLIIDEAQHLSVPALDQVRSIHDAACVGVVLVGNEFVYTRLTNGNRAAFLDRLYSRIGKRIALRNASDADIDALIAAWKINDNSCKTQIREIGRKPGALRTLTKVMRLAASYATAQEHRLCCDDIRAAARDLGVTE